VGHVLVARQADDPSALAEALGLADFDPVGADEGAGDRTGRLSESGSTAHDRRPASRRAPTIPSASGRKPEHEHDARARSPALRRPGPTLRSRASSPWKMANPAASVEDNKRRRSPTPRSTAVRDPQIPIGALAERSAYLPAVSSLGGFRAPAPGPAPPSQRAGTRNPSPNRKLLAGAQRTHGHALDSQPPRVGRVGHRTIERRGQRPRRRARWFVTCQA
jgi:hypothetical protein